MLTFLDLLVITFMFLVTLSLLALCLMFLIKNKMVQKISFYLVALLGVVAGGIGLEIFGTLFMGKMILSLVLAVVSIFAFVLERVSKGNEKRFKIARILAAVSLVLGIINAFT